MGEDPADALQDFGGGDDVLAAPTVEVAHVHVLDEADDVPRPLEASGEVDDAVVVHAALHDRVDLDGAEARRLRRGDAFEYVGDAVAASVHRAEDLVVEAVQAHRHAMEARRGQTLRVVGQEVAVGRHREVVDAGNRGEHRHEPLDVAAHQRLAAGEPDLAHAQAREDARGTGDLLVAQHLILGEELVARPEDFGRHAVGTAEVAPVGDRDAQVAQRPPQPVEDAAARPPVFGRLARRFILFAVQCAAIIPEQGCRPVGTPPAYTDATR